jgi:hypothetical protein
VLPEPVGFPDDDQFMELVALGLDRLVEVLEL